MRPKINGFTLVELMVTLVIAMLLIGVGAPSLKSLYEGYRADSEIRKVSQSLQFARSHAVSYGSRVTMCPIVSGSCNSDWSKGYKIFLDNGTANQIDGNDEILTVVGAFNSSDFVTYDNSSISYSPDGLLTGAFTSGQFVYCPANKSSDESLGIDLSPSGKSKYSTTSVNCM
ncbi:GspH/FimT family pseudopilin [Shewanella eurypsychrophilus]|uniref:Type II secretion system protein H n=1 Tax=Shewanella eurypsychrophilus TaxID=2593656 RepID=A0ABX6V5F3_9GAMM|nr:MULTISPECIES: GspH/FimT family pseudopilin [Shewanella]QFU21790.1 general secretion pathway protein GspH [Shewanella sp. YLB-09]QPG57080.1 GspH/FimT family pseudopilin [Shewanella eurypsychrophilus]